jgi:energy-coupling factor transport system ATP-binding protein
LERIAALLDDWTRNGNTVLTVTHDIDFAAEHFDDLILMAQGSVIARGDDKVLADESLIARAALIAPQLIRLARSLGWNETPARVAEFVEIFARRAS